MHVDGACHCGRITYEADVDASRVRICHCTDCQTLTGSAFRVTVGASEGSFRLLSGEPKIYIKTAESGRQRAHGFCADCGTPIYATSPGAGPKRYGLRVGSIRQRNQLHPSSQIWFRSAVAWLGDILQLSRSEKE